MCLTSETEIPIVSTEDIKCYKVLVHKNGELISPYREYKYTPNETIKDTLSESVIRVFGVVMIESGYFHSYSNINEAKDLVSYLLRKWRIKALIYNAIIPKGTKYFKGQSNDLCSKSIRITTIVNDE